MTLKAFTMTNPILSGIVVFFFLLGFLILIKLAYETFKASRRAKILERRFQWEKNMETEYRELARLLKDCDEEWMLNDIVRKVDDWYDWHKDKVSQMGLDIYYHNLRVGITRLRNAWRAEAK